VDFIKSQNPGCKMHFSCNINGNCKLVIFINIVTGSSKCQHSEKDTVVLIKSQPINWNTECTKLTCVQKRLCQIAVSCFFTGGRQVAQERDTAEGTLS